MVGGDGASSTRSSSHALLALGLLAVVAVQVLVIALGDSRFNSGSDAGGRAGSIAAAVENGRCDHDLGYWAAEADPTGRLHPHTNSIQRDDRYVQPASLPYVCAGAAATSLFGQPWAKAISVLGVVAAALGAWMLDRAAGGAGWLGFGLVGLVGSIAFYGSDTWEHAPAVGAAVLGSALLLTSSARLAAAGAGVLWGLAVALRTETALVAIALAVACLASAPVRRGLTRRLDRLVLFGCTSIGVVVADRIAERSVLAGDVRAARTATTSTQAASELPQRVRDAFVSTVGVIGNDRDVVSLAMGVAFVLSVVTLILISTGTLRSRPAAVVAGFIVALVLVNRVMPLGFLPGALVAAPAAVVGVVVAFRRSEPPLARALAWAALLSMPLIWAFQWTGTHAAQWGGRYQLTGAALLTIAGAPLLRRTLHAPATRVVVGAAVIVGVIGLAWHVERTNQYAAIWSDLESLECDGVLISASRYFLREGGATESLQSQRIDDCRLLTANPDAVPDALEVAAAMGASEALVVYRDVAEPQAEDLAPWELVTIDREQLGRIPVTLVRLELAPASADR